MRLISYLLACATLNFLVWELGTARVYKKTIAKENILPIISFAIGVLVGLFYML